mgnify:FL=1
MLLILVSALGEVLGQSYLNKQDELIRPRLYLTAGFYFPNVTTSLRLDSRSGIGTEIDLEDDLKLAENLSVFKAGGIIDLGGRSQLSLGFTNLNRRKRLELDEDIEFGDTVFYAQAFADLRFDVTYLAATYRYSFFEHPNWNAGLSLGLRGVQFKTSLEAGFGSNEYDESWTSWAPAALVGLHGSGYLTPRLLGRYSLEVLYLNLYDINFNIIENEASLQYFITESLGLGMAYSTNAYRIRQIPVGDDYTGKIIFAFGGFNLFLSARL